MNDSKTSFAVKYKLRWKADVTYNAQGQFEGFKEVFSEQWKCLTILGDI